MEDLQALIQKAQSGDRKAFGEIYKLYYEKIFRYCKFNTFDSLVAQDICQDSFVKAWKQIKNFKMNQPNWSFQAFLFTIARNLIIDRSRRKKEVSLENYEYIETNEDLYEDLEKKRVTRLVWSALSKLEEVERQIIVLRFFEEIPWQEVASILKMKEGALRVRQHRVMQKLKDIMEALYGNRN